MGEPTETASAELPQEQAADSKGQKAAFNEAAFNERHGLIMLIFTGALTLCSHLPSHHAPNRGPCGAGLSCLVAP